MKWLSYSNKVSTNVLFITAVCLWYVPYSGAGELVYWYVYKESKRDNLVRRYRNYLPKMFLRVYLQSKIESLKWAIENREDELKHHRMYENYVDDWNAKNA